MLFAWADGISFYVGRLMNFYGHILLLESLGVCLSISDCARETNVELRFPFVLESFGVKSLGSVRMWV